MTATDPAAVRRDTAAWSCDQRGKSCRDAHGCHCREITSQRDRIADLTARLAEMEQAANRPAEATGDAERVAELEARTLKAEALAQARLEDATKHQSIAHDMARRADAAEARACAAHVEVARLMREVERQRNRSDIAEQDYNAAVEAFRSGLGPAEARAQAAEAEAERLRDDFMRFARLGWVRWSRARLRSR